MHDGGLFSIFFISVFVITLIISVTKIIFSKNILNKEKVILSLITLNFLIEIFPLKSTGSIFTTWNGTILWLSIALINYKNRFFYYDK